MSDVGFFENLINLYDEQNFIMREFSNEINFALTSTSFQPSVLFLEDMRCIVKFCRELNIFYTFDKNNFIPLILTKEQISRKINTSNNFMKELEFDEYFIILRKPFLDYKIKWCEESNNYEINIVLMCEDYEKHEKHKEINSKSHSSSSRLKFNKFLEEDKCIEMIFIQYCKKINLIEEINEIMKKYNFLGYDDKSDFFKNNDLLLLSEDLIHKSSPRYSFFYNHLSGQIDTQNMPEIKKENCSSYVNGNVYVNKDLIKEHNFDNMKYSFDGKIFNENKSIKIAMEIEKLSPTKYSERSRMDFIKNTDECKTEYSTRTMNCISNVSINFTPNANTNINPIPTPTAIKYEMRSQEVRENIQMIKNIKFSEISPLNLSQGQNIKIEKPTDNNINSIEIRKSALKPFADAEKLIKNQENNINNSLITAKLSNLTFYNKSNFIFSQSDIDILSNNFKTKLKKKDIEKHKIYRILKNEHIQFLSDKI